MRSVLVPIVENDEDWQALHAALLIAKRFGGHVDALYSRGTVSGAVPFGEDRTPEKLRGELLLRLEAESAARASSALRTFAQMLRTHGIFDWDESGRTGHAKASWLVARSPMRHAIRRWGGAYDAIVFGGCTDRDDAWWANIEAALSDTGRALILAPGANLPTIGDRIVLVWTRTEQAVRALACSLPFLQRAQDVTVLALADRSGEGPSAEDIARYLERHGVAAQLIEAAPEGAGTGRLLLETACALQADLLVIGIRARHRLVGSLLGRLPQDLLRHAAIPVLVAQ